MMSIKQRHDDHGRRYHANSSDALSEIASTGTTNKELMPCTSPVEVSEEASVTYSDASTSKEALDVSRPNRFADAETLTSAADELRSGCSSDICMKIFFRRPISSS